MRRESLRRFLAGSVRASADPDPPSVNALVTVVACVASGLAVVEVPHGWLMVSGHLSGFATFLAVTLVLQLASVRVYGRGAFSFAGSGMLALGFTFGVGAAMVVSASMGVINLFRRRGRINRGIFDASQLALASATGVAVYRAFGVEHGTAARLLPALLGGAGFFVVNIGLLTTAMSVSEGADPREIFKERFRWMVPYHLISGALALALVISYERLGTVGLAAFAAPPAFMMFSVHQYLAKTTEAVEEVRQANEGLEAAVAALEERNADLQQLLDFAGGLGKRAHDRATLVGYAEDVLRRVTGTQVRVADDLTGQVPLLAGGSAVGSLEMDELDELGPRWQRLRDGLLPQLATALEGAQLVEEVRRRHLATIAALSRSMEAKDYYTGGHTERVAEVSVAIARRLGFDAADLDAIEVGALLHDIGKIGIPEVVLQKAGPLDDTEWELMRKHPVISDYILSGIDLHPYVRQIARSSHERIDGAGYPDGLVGDEIPLPARVVLVADALDALTTDRPYRTGQPLSVAMNELRAHTGTQFCPTVMVALERILAEEPHLLTGGKLRAVETGAA